MARFFTTLTSYKRVKGAFEMRFVLDEIPKGSYLAIALNGRFGYKGASLDAVVFVMRNGISEFKPVVWITAYSIPYVSEELDLMGSK